jgi:hypothetical protein
MLFSAEVASRHDRALSCEVGVPAGRTGIERGNRRQDRRSYAQQRHPVGVGRRTALRCRKRVAQQRIGA